MSRRESGNWDGNRLLWGIGGIGSVSTLLRRWRSEVRMAVCVAVPILVCK